MFPFTTFLASFSPFFLRNKRDQISLGRGMVYYFSMWGIVTLLVILISIIAGWIFVTPERALQWSGKIPEFSVTIKNGILTETGFQQDPCMLVDEQNFMIFISKTLVDIPSDKQGKQGIFILKDRTILSQAEQIGQKVQVFKYADRLELRNIHFDRTILAQKIVVELSEIKRIASMIVAGILSFIGILIAVWYCIWSFFWGFIVWLFSRGQKNPFTYEQAVGFVLSVFFPVLLIGIIFMVLEISFSFSMTLLFLSMLGYNHLSFYKEQLEQKL